jgi:hypothetical protein
MIHAYCVIGWPVQSMNLSEGNMEVNPSENIRDCDELQTIGNVGIIDAVDDY